MDSHRLSGKPVLPVAMTLEWMAHAALHDFPGMHLREICDFRVLRGVILSGTPLDLEVTASRGHGSPSAPEVHLEARTTGATQSLPARNASALAILSTEAAPPSASAVPDLKGISQSPYPRPVHAAYTDVLFHGPHFHGIQNIVGMSPNGMLAAVSQADSPQSWMTSPPRTSWILDPLVIDCCMQLGVLWAFEYLGKVALPSAVSRIIIRRTFKQPEALHIALRVTQSTDASIQGDMSVLDSAGVPVVELLDVNWTADAALSRAFGHRAVQTAGH